MTEDDGTLGPGRRFLRDGLGRLFMESGLTPVQAVTAANIPDTVMPLSKQRVSEWLAGNPPSSFGQLWVLVRTLLIAAGQEAPEDLRDKARRCTNETRRAEIHRAIGRWDRSKGYWQQVWQDACNEPGPASDPRLLRAYLTAARQAATAHPYSWSDDVPPLAEIHVRQETYPPANAAEPATGRPQRADMDESLSAAHVFGAAEPRCVLLAGPGGGKSTQARIHLAAATDRWLRRLARRRADRGDTAVPVLARATALTGTAPLPQALAASVAADLAEHGLLQDLTGLFIRHPVPKTPWLVVVDGLDEIPDHGARTRLLRTLTAAADAHPSLYRFIVLTRPLPPGELDVLGTETTCYTLQPFTPDDLLGYARRCFHDLDRYTLPSGEEHAAAFVSQLAGSGLDTLARTPLMAFMLTRLYSADPGRALPEGRSAAYRAFVALVYRQNAHKGIARTHAEAVRDLVDRHQDPADRRNAEQAARQATDHLGEIIDHLAHQRLHGSTEPAARAAARHPRATCPEGMDEQHWYRFLNDLLRPTGLLVQRGHDLDFLHQTVTEYLAVRHAGRDEQARAQLLDDLLPNDWFPRYFGPDPSYFGFVLDALLSSPGPIGTETASRLATVTDHPEACGFLVRQVRLRTNLPPEATAGQLARYAADTDLSDSDRVNAARGLAELDGHREHGAELLLNFAGGAALADLHRVQAARELTEMHGYRERGAELLAALAEDATLRLSERVTAGQSLAELDSHRELGADLLAALAQEIALEPPIHPSAVVRAAEGLAGLDGHREQGADLLVSLAENTALDSSKRLDAVQSLTKMNGYRERGIELLVQLANDTAFAPRNRVDAAEELSRTEGCMDSEAEYLTAMAQDPAFECYDRMRAAEVLAGLDGYRERGVELLVQLAENTVFDLSDRVEVTEQLGRLEGCEDSAADLLTGILQDPALDAFDRTIVVRSLLETRGHWDRTLALVVRLAKDTTLEPSDRVWVARQLGYREDGEDLAVELLAAFVQDAAFCPEARVEAAVALDGMEGCEDAAAELLAYFAHDTTFDPYARVAAAGHLASRQDYADAAAELLTAFAHDTTLDPYTRRSAARDLGIIGREGRVADLLTAFIRDPVSDPSFRVDAAYDLADLVGYWDQSIELLTQFAEDTTLDASARNKAGSHLSALRGWKSRPKRRSWS
ncbi:hypothetical protein [Streptomyces sp. NPDC127038]|uniref:hypothetical protein n=1 Tax=Streptomyces sp. NPDC127038 TaxID=3347114 RepID=UPI003653F723